MKIENFNKQTIALTVIILVLFVITLGLGLTINYSKLIRTIRTESNNKLNFYEFTQLISSDDLEDLAVLINVKDLKLLFHKDESAQRTKNNVLLINNNTNNWHGYDTRPIKINSDFRILLNFSGQNKDTAVTLSGQLSLPNQEWWENVHRMYITYNKKDKEFVLLIRDGTDLEKSEYISFCHGCLSNDTLIFKFADTQGKYLRIYNALGETVKEIDFTQLENASFPQGLFPNNQLFVGYNIPPYSELRINKLFFQQ